MRICDAIDNKDKSSGQVLIVVLGFVVLLTVLCIGLITLVSFQSISSHSTAQSFKAEMGAKGSISQVISDLQASIASGSNLQNGVYIPSSPIKMLPTISGFVPSVGIENLLQVSNATGRASGISTTAPAINGYSISTKAWNLPLLMTPNSSTDFAPCSSQFVAPNWIYTAHNGSNPTTWNSSLSASGSNPVMQRYAYTLYNEGGVLDANVVGCPLNTNCQPIGTVANNKTTLSYADLTQIPGLSTTSKVINGVSTPTLTLTQQVSLINALVGWRNFSSSQATGSLSTGYSFPTPSPNTNLAPFDLYATFNPTGFMTVGMNGVSISQSDEAFTSRQQLIAFLSSYGSQHGITANIDYALQYLGTFSRDISQPSWYPDPNRPLIVGNSSSGGNDGYGNETSAHPINSPLLETTVQTGNWLRLDGSVAVTGEPLIKKRFALNRLAWITYLGPSDDRGSSSISSPSSTVNGTDYDLYQLETNYEFTSAFLQQGTDTNIRTYFGLVWNPIGFWTYSPITTSSASHILSLAEIAALNREPNFIELLKAGILAGSIGKDFPSDISDTQQNNRYTSVDCSILQIAANIIDQFDCDGYPTHIQFTSSGIIYNFYGVENLPYLYRVRNASLTTQIPVTNPSIFPTGSNQKTMWSGTVSAAQPGQFTILQEPEVWNPHGWNPNDANTYGMGSPRPTSFQLAATLATPAVIPLIYPRSGSNGPGPTLGSINGILTFQVPNTNQGSGLFREPTLLITPNVPTGSALTGTPGTSMVTAYGTPYAYQNQIPAGITSNTGNPNQTNPFLGFVIGSSQICWPTGTLSGQTLNIANQGWISNGPISLSYSLSCNNPGASGSISYDNKMGNTLTSTDYVAGQHYGGPGSSSFLDMSTVGEGTYLDEMIPIYNLYDVFDPRTGRFGFQSNTTQFTADQYMTPPRPFSYGPMVRWISPQQNVMDSDRPDNFAGYGYAAMWGTSATYPPNSAGWSWGSQLFHGLFQQNNLNNNNSDLGFFNTSDNTRVSAPSQQYYGDPDNVVRRGQSAYVTSGTTAQSDGPGGSTIPSAVTTIGLPMAISVTYTSGGTATPVTTPYTNTTPGSVNMVSLRADNGTSYNIATGTIYSRPIILNRPFKSVAELGQVFSGTPWKNIDCESPESGYSGLLDIFCINDTESINNLVAGRVNLNTRQAPVLAAILNGVSVDTYGNIIPSSNVNSSGTLGSTACQNLANALVARTTTTPLRNLSELVGSSSFTSAPSAVIDGSSSSNYSGFSGDITNVSGFGSSDYYLNNIERFREAPIRALSNVGTVRVWSLLIDVIVQTGRFPSSTTSLSQFDVEAQSRCWVHVAIDRYTGKVLDEQIEEVRQ